MPVKVTRQRPQQDYVSEKRRNTIVTVAIKRSSNGLSQIRLRQDRIRFRRFHRQGRIGHGTTSDIQVKVVSLHGLVRTVVGAGVISGVLKILVQ